MSISIKEYIIKVLRETDGHDTGEVDFDIGSCDGITVNQLSSNRIKFTAIRKKGKP